MQRYVPRPDVVEAIQYQGPAKVPNSTPDTSLPQQPWLCWSQLGFDGERYPRVKCRSPNGMLEELPLVPGDWVLLDPVNHRNRVLSPVEFAESFQEYVDVPKASGGAMVPELTSVTPPYAVVDLEFGRGTMRPTRKYPSGSFGEILSEDEVAMWGAFAALSAENARLKAEAASPTGKKGK